MNKSQVIALQTLIASMVMSMMLVVLSALLSTQMEAEATADTLTPILRSNLLENGDFRVGEMYAMGFVGNSQTFISITVYDDEGRIFSSLGTTQAGTFSRRIVRPVYFDSTQGSQWGTIVYSVPYVIFHWWGFLPFVGGFVLFFLLLRNQQAMQHKVLLSEKAKLQMKIDEERHKTIAREAARSSHDVRKLLLMLDNSDFLGSASSVKKKVEERLSFVSAAFTGHFTLEPTPVVDLVNWQEAAQGRCELVGLPGPEVRVLADLRLARWAIVNLIDNALSASGGAKIEFSVQEKTVCFVLENEVPTLPSAETLALWGRVSLSSKKEGSGLGLVTAKEYLEKTQATLHFSTLERGENKFVCATVCFQRVSNEAAAVSVPCTRSQPRKAVLIIDDEESEHERWRKSQVGATYTSAYTLEQAQTLLEQGVEDLELVVLDCYVGRGASSLDVCFPETIRMYTQAHILLCSNASLTPEQLNEVDGFLPKSSAITPHIVDAVLRKRRT